MGEGKEESKTLPEEDSSSECQKKALLRSDAEDTTRSSAHKPSSCGATVVASVLGVLLVVGGALFACHLFVSGTDVTKVNGEEVGNDHLSRAPAESVVAVVGSKDPHLECNASSWPHKKLVCGACKVLVQNFSAPPLRSLRARRLGGSEEHSKQERGTCQEYCHGLGRSCEGAWETSEGGSCTAVWELQLGCDKQLHGGHAICSCGDVKKKLMMRLEAQASQQRNGSRHNDSHHNDSHHNDSRHAKGQAAHEHQEDAKDNRTAHEKHKDPNAKFCGKVTDNVDFWTKSLLAHIGGVLSVEECKTKCNDRKDCGAWTWGKVRNIYGLTDVCFLKGVDHKWTINTHHKEGVVSGLPENRGPCKAMKTEKEEKPTVPLVLGVIKSRHGQCLEAADRSTNGGRVQMWTCIEGDPNQQWAFDSNTGQIKNQHGICLDAHQRTIEYSPLAMYECDTRNWNQQWGYDDKTGLIKNWKGICIDGAERNIDGGAVYMRACQEDNWNHQWRIGPLADMPAVHDHRAAGQEVGTSLWCFALMLPGSYEQHLLAQQFRHKVSLFDCDGYAVYSNKTIDVTPGLTTGVVDSTLQCKKGGEFGTALNLQIFLAVWEKVFEDGTYKKHDWTVKVDPDAVFFASRLKMIIGVHFETPTGVYLNNCKFGMHGPLEVFSRNAVTSWDKGRKQCLDHFWKLCHGDCLWGEDMFVDQCLWRVLKVRRDNDYRLLVEDHCDPPDHWDKCEDGEHVALHPFKEADKYMKCLRAASDMKPKLLKRRLK